MYNFTPIFYIFMMFKFIGHILEFIGWYFGDYFRKTTFSNKQKDTCSFCDYQSPIILLCGCHAHISCMIKYNQGNSCIKCGEKNILNETHMKLYNTMMTYRNDLL
jgi:hypothetical protein